MGHWLVTLNWVQIADCDSHQISMRIALAICTKHQGHIGVRVGSCGIWCESQRAICILNGCESLLRFALLGWCGVTAGAGLVQIAGCDLHTNLVQIAPVICTAHVVCELQSTTCSNLIDQLLTVTLQLDGTAPNVCKYPMCSQQVV